MEKEIPYQGDGRAFSGDRSLRGVHSISSRPDSVKRLKHSVFFALIYILFGIMGVLAGLPLAMLIWEVVR